MTQETRDTKVSESRLNLRNHRVPNYLEERVPTMRYRGCVRFGTNVRYGIGSRCGGREGMNLRPFVGDCAAGSNIFDYVASVSLAPRRRQASDRSRPSVRADKTTSRSRTNMNRRLYSRHKSEDYFLSPGTESGPRAAKPHRPLRGLAKLNRCARSLKLYVVADTHAPPQPAYSCAARASTRARE